MTKREITSLVLKLMSVYIVIRYIGFFPLTVFTSVTAVYRKGLISLIDIIFASAIVILTLLYPVLCILLIIYSNRVAGWIIHEDNTVELPESVSKDDIMTIAFCCIGLVIMADAIPKLVVIIPQCIVLLGRTPELSYPNIVWTQIIRTVVPLIEFVLGLLLFIRTKGLVKLWHKIRG